MLPTKLHPAYDGLSPIHRDRLTRKEEAKDLLKGARDVEEVVVLICGHGGRDARCGVLGPVLRAEFERALAQEDVVVDNEPVAINLDAVSAGEEIQPGSEGSRAKKARVAVISHIGGHKFAGNVIIYVPPTWRNRDGSESELAGKGIWYGRVEPKHVEGIVKETVLGGRVIGDMFRGGIGKGGEVFWL